MTRYYIKSHFSGWQEVKKEQFDAFVDHLQKNIVFADRREDIIKSRTRIEMDETKPGGAV